LESRAYYVKQVVSTAKKYGKVPFYWDNGPSGNNAMGIFNRATGAVSDNRYSMALLKVGGELPVLIADFFLIG
jgi:endoglucanase